MRKKRVRRASRAAIQQPARPRIPIRADGLICRVVGRSNNNANANGGVAYANANNASSNSNTNNGSRLANNEIVETKNPASSLRHTVTR